MIRLVLIDDHNIILDGLTSLIEKEEDIQIINSFTNPIEALTFIEKKLPDVVITDLDMPKMKGEDVMAIIKSKSPHSKVLILSMHNEKSVIKQLIKEGADGYLSKSASKSEILNSIRTVTTGAKYFSKDVMNSLIEEDSTQVSSNFALKEFTEREIEVIKLIAKGLSSKQIGLKLFISHRTVETHRNNILKKLDSNGVAGIIRFAFQNKLIK